jgi:hypothetical protein
VGLATPVANLLTRPTASPSKFLLTADDCSLFKDDPTTLVDKQFLLKEGDGDLLYEVTEVRFLKGSWEYIVRFEGCFDCVNVLDQEMMEMLESSFLVKVN